MNGRAELFGTNNMTCKHPKLLYLTNNYFSVEKPWQCNKIYRFFSI